jgi:hypothetical protein
MDKLQDLTALRGKTIRDVELFHGEITITCDDGTSAVIDGSVHSIELPPPRAAADDRNGVLRTRIVCADGYSISVQASSFHYSAPRDNRFANLWLYDAVECGHPETPDGVAYQPADLEPYREKYAAGSRIYPYTPIGVVAAFVQAHGGAVSGGEIAED